MKTTDKKSTSAGEAVKITDMLKRLGAIVSWFESQKEMDVEKALEQVKEGVGLIKESKERLKEIENEFKEIKKSIEE
jgi:exodeoxyribonuclease VII small subunit